MSWAQLRPLFVLAISCRVTLLILMKTLFRCHATHHETHHEKITTWGSTFNIREAFKRKNRKYIGLLPIPGGGGVPPDQCISGFFPEEKTFIP